ncbi:DsbA family oxidoreductase [Rhodopila sp.]|jgi:predicted DsbA family dithiol-disulfide isomerase|uniref:DsbA family oxidoreductase n=1 Tax=Rhodopila sp. TaxID=2480087 RepID=UPI002BA4F19E|nr:DsbA family oxidoreductase [Rhodopila sp.]HVZ07429.1 DsbA family oxidoreductase [Rhodopila sp.]
MDDSMPNGDIRQGGDTRQGEVCGPDGCAVPAAEAAPRPAVATAGTRIDIVSDAVCPWCYIGKRQLERALAQLAQEGLTFSVHWNPFQLNPDMPKEGRDRTAYRIWKFGSAEQAAALDARITEAAAGVGLDFRTDLMTRTPNTIDAHRLVWFGGRKGVQDAVMEAVFKAYFTQGRDIGDREVLADCAAEAGLDRAEAATFLASGLADREMRAADQAAREAGVNGVPAFFLDGYGLFSGAMPAETIASALRRGRTALRQKEAAE